MTEARELLTIRQAAELTGLTKSKVRTRMQRGNLPAYRLVGTRCIRIRAKDVRALVPAMTEKEAE